MTDLAGLVETTAARLSAAGLVFGHGFDGAWDEAVALALHVTGLPDDRSALATPVTAGQQRRLEALLSRRIDERLPLAYLLGRCRFAGLEFLIEPGIVVPRSPIGRLLESRLAPWLAGAPGRILDLCCGSGCIGIVAARAFPDAVVDLIDVDPRAVKLARRNVLMHGLEARVRTHRSDLFDELPGVSWDLILSNPPYVDAGDMASLPAEYRHEPALGLAAGGDGLALVARILEALPERLAPGGLLVCEVGASARALLAQFPSEEFVWPELPDGGEGVFLLWRSAAGR